MFKLITRIGVVASLSGTTSPAITTTYQVGSKIAVAGIQRVKLALTVGKDQATDLRVRLMDYTDPSNPRPLQTTDTADPSTKASEHVYAAATKTDLIGELGGVIDAIGVEVKMTGAGVPSAGDSVVADLTIYDGIA